MEILPSSHSPDGNRPQYCPSLIRLWLCVPRTPASDANSFTSVEAFFSPPKENTYLLHFCPKIIVPILRIFIHIIRTEQK